ncbi:sensor histidine kinase [Speluncibacter jeojiensis]|uniref:sensor histidine kinase n=1 Tax=Speluncibacter jeojiensis TaxID=2710754 RepID=UPI00240FF8CD|nr:ATP-binding protein [Rhodococcus sp. D2-41]
MTTNRLPEPLRPSRWPLRVRSALAAAVVVGLALLVGAGALLWMLDRSLVGAVDSAATARATDIANQLTHDSPADLDAALFTTDSRISGVQIVSPSGQVVRTSSQSWRAPLIDLRLDPGQAPVSGVSATSGPESDLRVSARPAVSTTGPVTVLVAASKESVETTLITVAVLLAVGGPLIVLVAAAATWALVGRSLGSVEAIRSQVAAIGAAQLSERVPVPPARDEIARLATTMNAMLARIEAGHLAQRRFVGDASHELRSPLATLTAALEVARERPEAFDRALLTDTLLPETERMRDLVEDLLILARADETGIALRVGDVDLDDLADGEARRLRLRGDVTVHTVTAPVRIRGDRERLARVVRNLVDNAAAHAASTVALTTETSEPTARIVVDDDGPGIPDSERERVFERFVRLQDDRSRATGGSGLGLAIVTEIVAAHGGSVTIGDSPLGGARFVVELPSEGPDHRSAS